LENEDEDLTPRNEMCLEGKAHRKNPAAVVLVKLRHGNLHATADAERESPATGNALRGVEEHAVKHFVAIVMIAIGPLLAPDTKWSPRDCSEPLWADLLFAMNTDPKRTLFYPTKSRPHVSQQVRFAVEISYREVPLGRVLHFIQRICALLDSNSVTVPNDFFQLRVLADENPLEFV
jgi:hypothetical protein